MSTRNKPGVTVDERVLGEDLTKRLIWEVVGTHEYIRVKHKDGTVETYGLSDVDVAPEISEDATHLRERFNEKYEKLGNGCYEWKACTASDGYGWFWLPEPEGDRPAHRVAYRLWNGPIPGHLECRHLCRRRSCVHPEHLVLGTRKSNVHDAIRHAHNRREWIVQMGSPPTKSVTLGG